MYSEREIRSTQPKRVQKRPHISYVLFASCRDPVIAKLFDTQTVCDEFSLWITFRDVAQERSVLFCKTNKYLDRVDESTSFNGIHKLMLVSFIPSFRLPYSIAYWNRSQAINRPFKIVFGLRWTARQWTTPWRTTIVFQVNGCQYFWCCRNFFCSLLSCPRDK